MNRLIKIIVIVAMAVATSACGGGGYMAPLQAPTAITADPAAATIIFIRPSGYGGGRYAILDQQGKFLGELAGETYFAVKVPPGEHMFVSWGEGTPALKANVEAAKIYYVEMGMTIGAWSARARLFGVGPQRKNWAELREWLAESKMVTIAPGGDQKFMQDKGGESQEVLQKGMANWAEYDAEAKGLRSLTPADGLDAPL
jgi:hypothetical protein